MALSESQLKEKVMRYIKAKYPNAWLYKSADRWTSGIPDLILCIDGKFIAIELKVGNNKPTRIQQYVLKKIQEAGGQSGVCRSLNEVKTFLKERVGQ
jgi:hypothetical protein